MANSLSIDNLIKSADLLPKVDVMQRRDSIPSENLAQTLAQDAQPAQVNPNLQQGGNGFASIMDGINTFLSDPGGRALLGEIGQAIGGNTTGGMISKVATNLAQNDIADKLRKGEDVSSLASAVIPNELKQNIAQEKLSAKLDDLKMKESEISIDLKKEQLHKLQEAPTFEDEAALKIYLKTLGIQSDTPAAPKTIKMQMSRGAVPTVGGDYVGMFAYNSETGKYDKYQGPAPDTSTGNKKAPSLNTGLIEQANQSAMSLFVDEVTQGVKNSLGADVQKAQTIISALRDKDTGKMDIARAFEYLSPEEQKQFRITSENILNAVDRGINFGTAVRAETERRQGVEKELRSAQKKTIPNF